MYPLYVLDMCSSNKITVFLCFCCFFFHKPLLYQYLSWKLVSNFGRIGLARQKQGASTTVCLYSNSSPKLASKAPTAFDLTHIYHGDKFYTLPALPVGSKVQLNFEVAGYAHPISGPYDLTQIENGFLFGEEGIPIGASIEGVVVASDTGKAIGPFSFS